MFNRNQNENEGTAYVLNLTLNNNKTINDIIGLKGEIEVQFNSSETYYFEFETLTQSVSNEIKNIITANTFLMETDAVGVVYSKYKNFTFTLQLRYNTSRKNTLSFGLYSETLLKVKLHKLSIYYI